MAEINSLDDLHKDLYKKTEYCFYNFNDYFSEEELKYKLDAEEMEMLVIEYKELTDDENYNQIMKNRINSICNYCLDKIIELHNNKPIIVDEDYVFENAPYANYYSDVIERAYDISIIEMIKLINDYYINNKKAVKSLTYVK